MASLCFQEASEKRKSNQISEDVYLRAVLDHCTGVRHGKNKMCNGDSDPLRWRDDTFGSNIQDDEFTKMMARWIFCLFDESPLKAGEIILPQ
jgi:hypothetical protein